MVDDYLNIGRFPGDSDTESKDQPQQPAREELEERVETLERQVEKMKTWIQLLEERVHKMERKSED